MNPEGEIVARVAWDGRRVDEVRISARRPDAARVIVGKSADGAARIVPLLFSICARSQALAASLALQSATAAHGEATARDAAAGSLLETAFEHLRALLVELPRALHRSPAPSALEATRQALAALGRWQRAGTRPDAEFDVAIESITRIAQRHVYARLPAEWLWIATMQDLAKWATDTPTEPAAVLADVLREHSDLGASDVALMPELSSSRLAHELSLALDRSVDFGSPTSWNGTPVETGALARAHGLPVVAASRDAYGNGAATRVVARLADLAMLLQNLRDEGHAPSTRWMAARRLARDTGVAAVQTARGLLLHRTSMTDGCVSDYRIVAPTQWNFHPDGAFVRGLRGRHARDEAALQTAATIVLHSIDPCVPARIEVEHA